jgi:hypothetical protein
MNVVAQLKRDAAALREKLAGIETAIAALGGNVSGSSKTGRKRRRMSAETRKRMAASAKKRWAAKKTQG